MTIQPRHDPKHDEQPTPTTPTPEASTFDLPDLEPKKLDPDADAQVKGGARYNFE